MLLYFSERALLIAADALTTDGERLQGPSEQYTLEMEQALDSAADLAELDVDRRLCYHGIVNEGSAAIADIVDSLR